MVWVVGPVLAVILFAFLIILFCVLRKRRQNTKQPLEQGAVMTPLMSGFEMNNAQVVAAGGQAAHPHANGGGAGKFLIIFPGARIILTICHTHHLDLILMILDTEH